MFLWQACNALVFSRKKWSPKEVVQASQQTHYEFIQTTQPTSKAPSVPNSHQFSEITPPTRSPPPPPYFKMNTDASWNSNHRKCGISIKNPARLPPHGFGPTLSDIRHLATYFLNCVFSYIPGESNLLLVSWLLSPEDPVYSVCHSLAIFFSVTDGFIIHLPCVDK
ncbi:hypothetical protein NE237_001343 [Protea cynaroides]|uniref:Uncharacterized protein n=1 Tax=Protea cynaroides TaxID=273540 RepID=A0A9Q0KSW4_9MAGN|nr:hypothetical protein NE237_001343 [Protea cynaroides]